MNKVNLLNSSRFLYCLLVLLACVPAYAQSASELALKRKGGLAVVSGKSSVDVARHLGETGNWLVRVRVKQGNIDTYRKGLADLVPFVTIRASEKKATIADHTVNLVVLGEGSDLDLKTAKQLLCPGGQLITVAGGKWKSEIMPEDERHGDWTHWAADAQGTGIVKDTAVAPSTRLRWWDQSFIGAQLRTDAGVVVVAEKGRFKNNDTWKRKSSIMALDAYSGVPLWRGGEDVIHNQIETLRLAFVATDHGAIVIPKGELQHAVLFDLQTGKKLLSYDQGLKFMYPGAGPKFLGSVMKGASKESVKKLEEERHHQLGSYRGTRGGDKARYANNVPVGAKVTLMAVGDKLIQAYGRRVVCLDIPSGKLHWKVDTTDPVSRVHVSEDGQRMYLQESPTVRVNFVRWGANRTSAVTALSVEDGKQLWRNTEIGGQSLSQLIEYEGNLFAYDQVTNLKNFIQEDDNGDLYSLDPMTGKIQWHIHQTNGTKGHYKMLNNVIAWQDGMWAWGPRGGLRKFNVDGSTKKGDDGIQPRLMGGNQRCVRLSGSSNYLITGFTSWIGADGKRYQTGLTRGNCAMPNYAARGALMSVTDQTCNCYNGLRGQLAMIPGVEIVPIDDSKRLETVESLPVKTAYQIPDTALKQSWLPDPSLRLYWDHEKAESMQAGSVNIRVDKLHRVVSAYDSSAGNAKLRWQQRVSGRIYADPVTGEGLLYVPTADGRVSALDLKTGKVVWRFLAAPMEQEFVHRGQLESRWPVQTLLLHENQLYVAAGRHNEVDGGLWLWSLNPETGKVLKKVHCYTPMSVLEPNQDFRKAGLRWRGDLKIAQKSIYNGGFKLNKDGEVVLWNRRWWKSGSRPSMAGYWNPLVFNKNFKPIKDKREGNLPDPTRPVGIHFTIKFDEWNGQTIDPVKVMLANRKKK